MPGDDKKESRILRRLTALEQERKPFEDEWKDVTRLIFPRRNHWDKKPGEDKGSTKDIYDGTALAALTLMCDGLLGHLVPAGVPFFRLRPAIKRADQFKPLVLWLDSCRDHVLQVLERSNFYSALGEVFPDAGSLGTAVMFVEEEIESQRVNFSVRHLKELYVAENRWGEVDTVYRKFTLPLEHLVELFEDSLDERMIKRAEDRPDDTAEVLHAVEKDKTGRRAFTSTYVLLDGSTKDQKGRILSEGGYDWMPYIVWRFRKNSDESYGRSPAMDALYDVAMINHQAKTMAEAAHKAVDPPLIAHESMRGKIKLNPRGITYWDQFAPGGQLIGSVYGGALGQYPLGIDAMERRAKIIREHFRSDFFSYLLADATGSGRDRTATEVNAIEAQKAAVLGATIGRVTKELLEPAITIVYNIESQAGRMPEMPEGLMEYFGGMPIEVEYTGPLAAKQKQYLSSQGVLDGIAAVSGIVQATGRMEVLDKFDFDKAAERAATANGMPNEMVLDEKMVKKIRQARAQQQAAMQQAALELEAAKVAPDPNKAPEAGSPADEVRRTRGSA